MRHNALANTTVGYLVTSRRVSDLNFVGTATVNGDTIEHELTLGARPHNAFDVGRNADGDLVWISLQSAAQEESSSQLSLSSGLKTFEWNPEGDVDVVDEPKPPPKKLVTLLNANRRTVMFALGVVCVLVVVGVSIPAANNTTVSAVAPTAQPTSSPQEIREPHDPEGAAINFVLTGQVSGISVPAGVNPSDFSATVVSQSGEIVLVDVQLQTEAGLTTFATLLLQKSGTAWRIREVFDPR
ncbi:MAG: hypothetical protein RL720_147 [Actinomycetota bacterium]